MFGRAVETSQSCLTLDDIDPSARVFYTAALRALDAASVPFLVGGAYALTHYAGIVRQTKDLDVFVRRRDIGAALDALTRWGYDTHLTFPHWLGKAFCGDEHIDIIFSSGNGIAEVDEEWFEHSRRVTLFHVDVGVCPPEEIIWAKAFIMERERYDGADVAHVLIACSEAIDWNRLLLRFGDHWRVLLSQLILFGFIYPAEQDRVPGWVLRELIGRLERESQSPPELGRVCRGTLLSRAQYLVDVRAGYSDARLWPIGTMTSEEIALWTAAIETAKAPR
jgi:hypothetical protein